MRAAAVDTVVHNDIVQFPEPGRPRAALHDINVIGTLQLLTMCGGLPTLRAIVVRGSAAIYGSEPGAPAFFTEEDADRFPLRTRFQRDIGELERLVGAFARRHPAVTCTVLRLQPVVGRDLDTPVNRLRPRAGRPHRARLRPAGAAARRRRRGRRAAPGGAASRCAGRSTSPPTASSRSRAPCATPTARRCRSPRRCGARVVGAARGAAGQPALPDEIARYLRFGRGVDTTRMRRELRFQPRPLDARGARGATAAA